MADRSSAPLRVRDGQAVWRAVGAAVDLLAHGSTAAFDDDAAAALGRVAASLGATGASLVETGGGSAVATCSWGTPVPPGGARGHEIVVPLVEAGASPAQLVFDGITAEPAGEEALAPLRTLADALVLARARRRLDRRLAERDRLYSVLAHTSSDMVSVIGPDGAFSYVSPACEGLLGLTPAEMMATRPADLVHPIDRPRALERFGRVRAGHLTPFFLECRLHTARGSYKWVESNVTPVLDADSGRIELHASTRDVSRHKRAEAALARQATHDALTELPNRRLFVAQLGEMLEELRRHPGLVGVLFVDLDGFKAVNDAAGHEVGDLVLLAVARRLAATVRPGDVVGRFGGDEFTVVLRRLGEAEHAQKVAERIIAAVAVPLDVGGFRTALGASVGIVVTADPDAEPGALLRAADGAMYRAKAAGKGRAVVA